MGKSHKTDLHHICLLLCMAGAFILAPIFALAGDQSGDGLPLPDFARQKKVRNTCPKCQEVADELNQRLAENQRIRKAFEETREAYERAQKKSGSGVSQELELERRRQQVNWSDARIEVLRKELENCQRQHCGDETLKKPAGTSIDQGPGPKEPDEVAKCPDCREIQKDLNRLRYERQQQWNEHDKDKKEYENAIRESDTIKKDYDKLKETIEQTTDKSVRSLMESSLKAKASELAKCRENIDAIKARMDLGRRYIDDLNLKIVSLIAKIRKCNEKCPSGTPGKFSCPEYPFQPIMIGEQSKYGSSAGNTAKDVARGVLGGLAGGFLGGGGKGGSPANESPADTPPLDRNPFSDMKSFTDPGSGAAISLAGKQTEKGFLLAAGVKEGNGNPTIHSMTLHRDDDCSIMTPSEYHLYQLWGRWWISVSWTRTTYVNNQVTSRKSGGWSSSGTIPVSVFAPGGEGSAWQNLGFDRATGGPRTVGAEYVTPQGQPVKFPDKAVVHITQPDKDPVKTVPFVFQVDRQPDGGFNFKQLGPMF